ncbi:MAG: hypothetical protein NZ890_05420 [Myxococcota bacterium]|nr:hypothetical protein [Myxococcota bacterium]
MLHLPRMSLLGLVLLGACSKGGLTNNDPRSCRRLAEEDGMELMLPRALYAELRSADGTTSLPVMLEGSGGSYHGTTRPLARCDPPGTYYVDRIVLVHAAGAPVATALRSGSSYLVLYHQGGTATVDASRFTRPFTILSAKMSTAMPTLGSLSAPGLARQGDRIQVTAMASAANDDCGMREMQFWLTTSPGVRSSPLASVSIAGGSGSATLRIPPELPAGMYVLEGRLQSQLGRIAEVRRQNSHDASYSLYNPVSMSFQMTNLPVVRIAISDNATADRRAPQAVSMEATPARVARCQAVSLSLRLVDDFGLPATQQVKVRLGPLGQPGLARALLSGGGEMLGGMFTVPQDAPTGIWLAYPESVQDAAGNVATASLSGDKFTLVGPGLSMPQPVQAAAFVVHDESMPVGDLAPVTDLAPATDMAPRFPAELSNIEVTPPMVAPEQTVTVTVTWTDHSGTLR